MEDIKRSYQKLRLFVLDVLWLWGEATINTIQGDLISYIWRFISSLSLTFFIAIYLQYKEALTIDLNNLFDPYFWIAFLYSIPIVFFVMLLGNVSKRNRDLSGYIEPEKYITFTPYNPKEKLGNSGIGVKVTNNNSIEVHGAYVIIWEVRNKREIVIQMPSQDEIRKDIKVRDKVFNEFGLPWKFKGQQNGFTMRQIPPYSSVIFEIANWDNQGKIKWSNRVSNDLPDIEKDNSLIVAVMLHIYPPNNKSYEDGRFIKYYIEVVSKDNKLVAKNFSKKDIE